MSEQFSNIGNEEQSFQSNAPNESPLEGIKSELHTIVDKLQLDEPPSVQQGRPLWQRVLSWAVPLWLVAFFVVWCYNARVDTCGGAKVKYRGNVLCITSERDYLLLNETYETEFLARDTSEPMPIDSLNQKKYDDLTETIKSKYADTTVQDVDTRTRLTFLNALRGNGLDSASYCRNLAMGYYNVAVGYLNKGNRDSACIAYRFLKDWHWKDSVLTKGELAVLEQICEPKAQPQATDLPTKRLETVENITRTAQAGAEANPFITPPTAQKCDYTLLFKQGIKAAADSLYDKALLYFNSARHCDPTKGKEIDEIINRVFAGIQKQRQTVTPVESITTKVGNVSFDMVKVVGGTFKMGSEDKDASEYEQPVHSVTLSDFYIGRYEVTQKQWRDVMGSDPPELVFKGCDNCPVESVSWDDIQEFLKKLNSQSKTQFRLPTEAEWEFAARGGNASKGYKYSGSDNIDELAWYYSNSGSKTHPVGTKKANELGIHDMSGNVYEWCNDLYDSYKDSYRNSIQNNPTGADKGAYRVGRGGSWSDNAQNCRVSYRDSHTPTYGFNFVGFRVVLSP